MKPPNEQGRAALDPTSVDFPLVGIGASAGGLQALQRLLPGLPAQPGFSLVVIMHMAREQPSALERVLQWDCDMRVGQLTGQRTALRPNYIYVIAPGMSLKVEDGFLVQEPLGVGRGAPGTIDCFFHSLALAQRPRSVGLLLSGLGHDGCSGLAALRAEGGIVIAQAPLDAQFGDLPQAAIDAGQADLVLPASAMAERLLTLCGAPDAESEAQAVLDALEFVHQSTGHDFSQYKRPTILRRMENRRHLHGLPSLGAYRDLLRRDADETSRLSRDLLIGVTGFFRDREVFARLRDTVLPALLAQRASGELRIWVTACSTGQEAYSLAILLADQVRDLPNPPPIKIFATDIDEHALRVARAGIYPQAIGNEVPAPLLQRYFVLAGKQYRVRQAVREMVTFACHDLLRDPPFPDLDLVTCRNCLIYFERQLQRDVLESVHFSMRREGYLLLGNSESTDMAPGLFDCVDLSNRLYRVAAAVGRVPAQGLLRRLPTLPQWPDAAARVAGTAMDGMRERLAAAEQGWQEMQSDNAELSLLNAELQSQLERANQACDDLAILVASAELASVLVDPALRVKRYTPQAAGIFNLIARDIGRSLLDITHRLNYPQLAEDVALAFEAQQVLEREVSASGGARYFVRVQPCRTSTGAIDSVVLNFFDISARRAAEDEAQTLASSQAFLLHLGDCLRPITDPVQLLALGCDMLGEQLAVSQLSYAGIDTGRFAVMDGYAFGLQPLQGKGEVAGLGSEVLSCWRDGNVVVRSGRTTLGTEGLGKVAGESGAMLSALCSKGGHWHGFFLACQTAARVWTELEVALFQKSAERIGTAYEAARAQAAMKTSETRLRGLLRGLAKAYWETDSSGLPLGEELLAALHPDDRAAIMQRWSDAVLSGSELDTEIRLRDDAGAWRRANMLVKPLFDEWGEVLKWTCCILDGSEQAAPPSGSI